MASGDTLSIFTARDGVPTATAGASHTIIAGTSTPAEGLPALAFDSSTQEYADIAMVMPDPYSGGGLTCRIQWAASSATAGHVVQWQLALRRVEDDVDDFNTTSHTYEFNSVVADVPTAVGEHAWDNVTFTNGVDMDSVVAGDFFIVRATRKAPTPDSGTQATGDAYLIAIEIRET